MKEKNILFILEDTFFGIVNIPLDPAVKPRGVKGVYGFSTNIDVPRLDRGIQDHSDKAKKASSSLRNIEPITLASLLEGQFLE